MIPYDGPQICRALVLVALGLLEQACVSDEVTTTLATFQAPDYECFAGPPVRTLLVELHVPGNEEVSTSVSTSGCSACFGRRSNCAVRRACVVLPEPRTLKTVKDLTEIASELRFPGVDLRPVCLRAMSFSSSLTECEVPEEVPSLCASTLDSVSLSVNSQVGMKVTCRANDVPCSEPFDLICPDQEVDACDLNAADVHTCVQKDYVDCIVPMTLTCPPGEVDACDINVYPIHSCVQVESVPCRRPLDLDCPQGLIDACAIFPNDNADTSHACVEPPDYEYCFGMI